MNLKKAYSFSAFASNENQYWTEPTSDGCFVVE